MDNLTNFIAKTFATVDPGTDYLPNWHIDMIADKLEQAAEGKIKRLIINVPPRSLKSISVSVAWSAWLLGKNPSAKIMAASYSQQLSYKHSLDCRLVMESDWYKEMCPDTIIAKGENQKAKFVTTKRGFRFATSVGGTATGEGGDFLIVDDPLNVSQAASDILRNKANDWFDQTFMTRLNNKKTGVIVVVMQRLHVDDLTGHLLKKKGWELLCLPAVAEETATYPIGDKTYTRQAGDLLHPAREDWPEMELAKEDLGSWAFSAQYQQAPVPLDGGMVNLKWFQRYNTPPGEGRIVQSWDTAIKAGGNNDFSVCTTWLEGEKAFYLLDVMAFKAEYPELKRKTISMAQKWDPDVILIEDKASGQSLIQDLRRESKLVIIPIKCNDSKTMRFSRVTTYIEGEKVYLPERSAWLADYEAEMMAFPNGAHDDMVDSTSQFLNWIRAKENRLKPSIKVF
ncbi:MAG: putative phage terminase-like protein [Rickettsiaceae bacterium]|nr:putative phage terminase-like protein [Rickettsiaceae bacterium]